MRISIYGLLLLLLACVPSGSRPSHSAPNEADEILQMIRNGRPVMIQDAHIRGTLDLRSLPSHPVYQNTVGRDISIPLTFINCTFEGAVIAGSSDPSQSSFSRFQSDIFFDNCHFEKDVRWRDSRFQGTFSMVNCSLQGTLELTNVQFGDRVDLSETFIAKDLEMSYARARMNWVASGLEVGGTTYMQGAIFYGDAHWSNSIFHNYADLSKLRAYGDFLWDYTTHHGPVVISNGLFMGQLNLGRSEVGGEGVLRKCQLMQAPTWQSGGAQNWKLEENRVVSDENFPSPSIK